MQLVHATAFTKDTPQQQSRSPKTPSQQHGAALDALDKHCGTTESGKPSQLGSRTKQSLATVSMGGPRVHPHKRPLPRRSCCAEPTRDAQTAGNRCCHHGTEMDSFACPRGTDARRVNGDSIERGLERDNRYRGSLNSYPKDEELRISAADSERGTRPAAPTGTARSPSRVAVTGCRQRWLRGHATALICCFRPASQLAARILGKGAGGFLYQIVFSAVLQMAAHRFRTSFSAEV